MLSGRGFPFVARPFRAADSRSIHPQLSLNGAVFRVSLPQSHTANHTMAAPCLPQAETHDNIPLSDRRGRTFVTRKIDGLWVTVWNDAYFLADHLEDSGLNRFRIDLSWSPVEEHFPDVIRTVMGGRTPANTHPANFGRGLA